MSKSLPRFVSGPAVALVFLTSSLFAADPEWVSLFDGKTLEGWEKVGNQESVWEVKDGSINGSGPASMLVCTKGPYKNFRYRAEIKINDRGNSGLYFRLRSTNRQHAYRPHSNRVAVWHVPRLHTTRQARHVVHV